MVGKQETRQEVVKQMGILKLENVGLTLDDNTRILNEVTLNLWEGHIHALVGPNGAGKSTLAFAVMGLSGYQEIIGNIYFRGESLRGLSVSERAQRGITLAWQEPARYEGLSVDEFIRAASQQESTDAVSDALSQVGLHPDIYVNRAVDTTLSGGERKKVELASIVAMRPRLVLLDEPDSGIDVSSLEQIFGAIRLLKQMGSTVLLITHSLAVLEQAEHAFLMCSGTIIDKGDIGKIRPYFVNKCLPCNHKNIPELTGVNVDENR